MLNFFKNKNGVKSESSRPAKFVAFLFVFIFIFSGVFAGITEQVNAQGGLVAGAAGARLASTIYNSPTAAAVALVNGAAEAAAQAALWITSWALWASAVLLEAIIQISIVSIGDFINSGGVITAWQTFRDLANMFFIFIILYIAINTILGTGGIDLKKMLARIVIVAILLNFSFFITKVAIDASNIVAVSFYNQIVETPCGTGANAEKINDIGEAFMCKMGLASFFDKDSVKPFQEASGTGSVGNILLMGLMGSLFFLIAAFVFFAAAVMFIGRLVSLIFLFVLSPLAFASTALPKDKYSGEWFSKLTEVCIWPPAFMAMIWATLQVLSAVALDTRGATLLHAVNGVNGKAAPGAGEVILNYAIVIALIIGSLVVAKKLGAYGAGGAVKMLQKTRDSVQGYIGGTVPGFVGRNTLGRAALGADKVLANKIPGGDSRVGRYLREYTTGAVAESKFGGNISRKDDKKRIEELKTDIINKAGERKATSTIKAGAKIEVFPDGTTPQARVEGERLVSRMSNEAIDNAGFKGVSSYVNALTPSQLEHILEKSTKFNDEEKDKIREARFKKIDDALKALSDAESSSEPDPTKKEEGIKAAKKALGGVTGSLSDKEVEIQDPKLLSNAAFIQSLKPAQIESLMKNNKIAGSEKKGIKDLRMKPLRDAIAQFESIDPIDPAYATLLKESGENIKNLLAKMGPKQVAKFDIDTLRKEAVIAGLTGTMLNEIIREGSAEEALKDIGAIIKKDSNHPAYKFVMKGNSANFF
jgi:hypothetical protein